VIQNSHFVSRFALKQILRFRISQLAQLLMSDGYDNRDDKCQTLGFPTTTQQQCQCCCCCCCCGCDNRPNTLPCSCSHRQTDRQTYAFC